jgi:hypothetical protein
MKSKARTVVLAIVIVTLFGMLAVARETKSENDTDSKQDETLQNETKTAEHSQNDAPALSAILFVNSKSCPCTLERCRTAETIVDGIKEGYSDMVTCETVDWELQHERAVALVKQFRVFIIPTLIVLDKEKQVVWRCQDFSKKEQIYSKIKQLAGKSTGTNGSN